MTVVLRYTSGGETFDVHANSTISRPAIGMGPSGGWKMRGLATRIGSGFIPFDRIVRDGLPERLFYKNGKPIYCIADWDHGTNRVQMGPGLSAIWTVPHA